MTNHTAATPAIPAQDRKTIPNDSKKSQACNEEVQFLSLLLHNDGKRLMPLAYPKVQASHFWTETLAELYQCACKHWDRYQEPMSLRAYESYLLDSGCSPEHRTTMAGKYFHVIGTFGAQHTEANLGKLMDGILERSRMRDAYWACVDSQMALLEGKTVGAMTAIERLHEATKPPAVKPTFEFPVLKPSEVMAYTPDPKDWIMGDGWLKRGSATIATASTGIGKSVFVEQLAVCCATGTPFIGMPCTRDSSVLLVQAENDEETMSRDLSSITVGLGLDAVGLEKLDANLRLVHAYGLTGEALAAWLSAQVEAFHPDLLVMDNYQAFIHGDINRSDTFTAFRDVVDPICKANGMALLLVQHTGKPRDTESWAKRELVHVQAGTSGLSNWARRSCELFPSGDDGRYKVSFSKNNESTGLVDDKGVPLRHVYLEHSGNPRKPYWKVCEDQSKPSTVGKYDSAVLTTKQDHWDWTLRKIADKVGCAKSTADRVLRENKEQLQAWRDKQLKEEF